MFENFFKLIMCSFILEDICTTLQSVTGIHMNIFRLQLCDNYYMFLSSLPDSFCSLLISQYNILLIDSFDTPHLPWNRQAHCCVIKLCHCTVSCLRWNQCTYIPYLQDRFEHKVYFHMCVCMNIYVLISPIYIQISYVVSPIQVPGLLFVCIS